MKKHLRFIASSVGAAGMFVVGSAHAALPTGATTAFTTISTDAQALIDLAWPVVLLITGGFITLKLFKKTANKAT